MTVALPFTPAPEFYAFVAMAAALPAFVILAVVVWWTDPHRRWPHRRGRRAASGTRQAVEPESEPEQARRP